jgi:ureidoglycolate dehydrogenase (NAD+)
MIYLNNIKLSKILKKVLTKLSVNKDSVNHVVNSLVETSLRGVDSHGINLFPHYCRAIRSGRINKNPDINILDTGVSTSSIDADHAFGHHVGAVAIDKAIKLSEKTGISAVNVKNSTHFGAASYFGLREQRRIV